jgi:hypothetical protein
MNNVSILRLNVLRAAYLFVFVGLGLMIWPLLLNPPQGLEHFRSVTWSLLGAVGVLAAIGIRYPLQMLPLLLFELLWKTIWVLTIGLPQWNANTFTAASAQTWNDCLVGIIMCVIAIPWRYVLENYLKRSGERWRTATSLNYA